MVGGGQVCVCAGFNISVSQKHTRGSCCEHLQIFILSRDPCSSRPGTSRVGAKAQNLRAFEAQIPPPAAHRSGSLDHQRPPHTPTLTHTPPPPPPYPLLAVTEALSPGRLSLHSFPLLLATFWVSTVEGWGGLDHSAPGPLGPLDRGSGLLSEAAAGRCGSPGAAGVCSATQAKAAPPTTPPPTKNKPGQDLSYLQVNGPSPVHVRVRACASRPRGRCVHGTV